MVPYPQSWRQILISFMPKIPGITNLKYGRLLCMQNAVSRWFSSCIVLLVEGHVERYGVFRHIGLYGFQGHRRTHEITASLKHIGNMLLTGLEEFRRGVEPVDRPGPGGQCDSLGSVFLYLVELSGNDELEEFRRGVELFDRPGQGGQ
eukprot:8743078-Pyramimonas_sp.AAC.1